MFIIDFSKNLKTTKKPNLSEPLREKANFLHKVSTGIYEYLSWFQQKPQNSKKPNHSEPLWQKASFLHKVLAGNYEYLSLISAISTKQQKNHPTTQSLSDE